MQVWRYFLFPFSWMYAAVMAIRNSFFRWGVFSSYPIPGKSIVIGNLSMGGTGKSPHTLYIHQLLSPRMPVALLSRGYGRKTRGLFEVHASDAAEKVGDEPLMFKKRVGRGSCVVVSEERKQGVTYIRSVDERAVILLDDAYQHRKVQAGFSVLLTDYNRPFYSDFVVPAGTLREWRSGKKRADCVVVTKCPQELSEDAKKKIRMRVGMAEKPVFFSQIIYGKLVAFGRPAPDIQSVLLVSGIANPKPLEDYLKQRYEVVTMAFPDHHNFSATDISEIHRKIGTFASKNVAIVTTEKDFVRLESLLSEDDKAQYPWYYQSIGVRIDEEETFKALINKYVDTI